MKQVPLAAKIRTLRGSSHSRRLRTKGFVPAEVYGHKEPNQSIEVPAKDLETILASSRGENIFFNLNIEGAPDTKPVLVVLKEIQYNKLDSSVLHADFHKVKMDEKIRIKIPIRILNADICEGVKIGGVLQSFIRSLEVQCLPGQIPEAIQVDAAPLAIGHSVHVSDLKLPEGIKALQPGSNVVVSVAQQMAEEVKPEVVAAPLEGAAGAEPEVITAKKKEGEGAEGPTDAKAAEGKADAKAPAGKADAKAPAGKADAKAPAGKAEAKPGEKKQAEKK
jgi:large subunit ribosomal protein L25